MQVPKLEMTKEIVEYDVTIPDAPGIVPYNALLDAADDLTDQFPSVNDGWEPVQGCPKIVHGIRIGDTWYHRGTFKFVRTADDRPDPCQMTLAVHEQLRQEAVDAEAAMHRAYDACQRAARRGDQGRADFSDAIAVWQRASERYERLAHATRKAADLHVYLGGDRADLL